MQRTLLLPLKLEDKHRAAWKYTWLDNQVSTCRPTQKGDQELPPNRLTWEIPEIANVCVPNALAALPSKTNAARSFVGDSSRWALDGRAPPNLQDKHTTAVHEQVLSCSHVHMCRGSPKKGGHTEGSTDLHHGAQEQFGPKHRPQLV